MSNTIAQNYSFSRIVSQVTAHVIFKLLLISAILLGLSACTGANENRDAALQSIIPIASVATSSGASPSEELPKTGKTVFSQSSRVGMLP